jgi:hypothetical protein
VGERAQRAYAATADATLAAERVERAAAAQAVTGRARQPSLHAFFAHTTPAAAQKAAAAHAQRQANLGALRDERANAEQNAKAQGPTLSPLASSSTTASLRRNWLSRAAAARR